MVDVKKEVTPRYRNMEEARMKGNRPLRCGCHWAGCPQIADVGYYCPQHMMERAMRGADVANPRYVQKHEPFGGTTHNVSYDTKVGSPENGKNKL